MQLWKKTSAAIPVIVFALAMAGSNYSCKDSNLKTLAKTCRSVIASCDVLTDDVIALNESGKITRDQQDAILIGLQKIVISAGAANAMIEPLVLLDPKTKVDLLQLVDPILIIIDDVIKEDLVNIHDEAVREKITVTLSGIRLSVQAALMILK